MENTVIELFYSKTCPNCKPQKNLLEEESFEADVRFTNVSKQRKRTKKYGIRSVPTTIVHGEGEEAPLGFTGVTRAERLRKAVKVASGDADSDELEPESVFRILKRKLIDVFKR